MFLSESAFMLFRVSYFPYVTETNISLSSISLLKDQLFKVGIPPFALNEASKI